MQKYTLRLLFTLLLGSLTGTAIAQTTALPPPPPPPPMNAAVLDEDLEPQITIIKQTDLTVEEFRSGGKLYMIKITPKIGKPYYMVDERGDGKFARQESLDSGVRPPRWAIHKF